MLSTILPLVIVVNAITSAVCDVESIVSSINKGQKDWAATATNKFSTLSADEFAEKYLMPRQSTASMVKDQSRIVKTKVTGSIPDSFDWRDVGGVSAVQNQGSCGTCWAFSTIGAIESAWFQKANETTNLSEMYLTDCDGTSDETHADCSMFGGWPYLAYSFIISKGGQVPSEEAYPYCCGVDPYCYPCMNGPVSLCGPPPYSCDRTRSQLCTDVYNGVGTAATITDWMYIDEDEEQIKAAVYSSGPKSVLIDASQLQWYNNGVWTGKTSTEPDVMKCSTTYLNHAVLVVGYGNDADTGLDYWIVKNSWGEDWGEEGYFRLVRGVGACGVNTQVTAAIA